LKQNLQKTNWLNEARKPRDLNKPKLINKAFHRAPRTADAAILSEFAKDLQDRFDNQTLLRLLDSANNTGRFKGRLTAMNPSKRRRRIFKKDCPASVCGLRWRSEIAVEL
jgi:hypothetical protein